MTLDSTIIQAAISIDSGGATYQQLGQAVISFDLQGEISDTVRRLLPLIFIWLAAGMCFLDSGIKILVNLFFGGGWLEDLRLIFYAIIDDRSGYYGLGTA